MTIQVLIKQAGKRKQLAYAPLDIQESPNALGALIEQIVQKEVRRYNSKPTDADIVRYLVKEEIDAQSPDGKIGFGRRFGQKKVDAAKAADAALLAFTDGLYRVFIDDKEIQTLEESIELTEGSIVAFIRLTFLAGRMW